MALAMGGWAEQIEDPADVGAAIRRARKATEDGQASLLEFITSEEIAFSHRRPFSQLTIGDSSHLKPQRLLSAQRNSDLILVGLTQPMCRTCDFTVS